MVGTGSGHSGMRIQDYNTVVERVLQEQRQVEKKYDIQGWLLVSLGVHQGMKAA